MFSGDRTLPGAIIERYFYRGRPFLSAEERISSVRKGGSLELGSSEFSALPVSPPQSQSPTPSPTSAPDLALETGGLVLSLYYPYNTALDL